VASLTDVELIHELSADPGDAGQVVRLWCGTVDCVVTGVRRYVTPDGQVRLDIEFVNRLQEEPGHEQ
jgi:hypothetical protein